MKRRQHVARANSVLGSGRWDDLDFSRAWRDLGFGDGEYLHVPERNGETVHRCRCAYAAGTLEGAGVRSVAVRRIRGLWFWMLELEP